MNAESTYEAPDSLESVDFFTLRVSSGAVQLVKKMLVLAIVFAWVPMSAHCKLEAVPGFSFLACESTSGAESDCDEKECCAFEFSVYKTDQVKLTSAPAAAQTVPVSLFSNDSGLDDHIFLIEKPPNAPL